MNDLALTDVLLTEAQRQARREFAALLPRRADLNERRLPPYEFNPTFPPIAELGWDAGWERVPDTLAGPVELVLLGLRLRWVRLRRHPQPDDPDAWYDGRAYYASDVNAHRGPRQLRSR